jgi:NTP pyrophosphatase (non-canonical NTP hydrolase)
MNIKALQNQIKGLSSNKRFTHIRTQEEIEILTYAIKLNEEVGELCNDTLSVLKLQRKSKLERFDKRNFYEEFADVIITTIQLANAAGVDIERAVNDKLTKIEERYKKDH